MTDPKNTLWTALHHQAKKAQATKEKSNLFHLLHDRSKVENIKPRHIDYVRINRVVEKEAITKAKGITETQSLLNVTYHVLKNPKTNEYFRLDEKEKFLWDMMDGRSTIRDLAIAYFQRYGAFAYDKIIELVSDLKRQTFLTESSVDVFQSLSVWAKSKTLVYKAISILKRFLFWEFPVPGADRTFSSLYRYGCRIFFHPFVRLGLLMVAAIGFGLFLRTGPQLLLPSVDSLTTKALILLGMNVISLLFHELAHGLATVHYKRHVQKAGFLIYFGAPAFFVDTTDMWMESKVRRMWVTAVGPLAQAILAGAVSISLLFAIPTDLQPFLYALAAVSYASIFVNLNPLIEWDGYFLLMDIIGIPCLRRRSLHFVQKELWKKLLKRSAFTKEELLYTVFGALSAAWSVVAVLLAIHNL